MTSLTTIESMSPHEQSLAQWRGQRIVVKVGGEVVLHAKSLDSLASQIALLSRQGVEVVLVHGGGPQADTLANRLGHMVRKVAGRRVTDDAALEVAKMVYGGSINADLLAALGKHGARAVGLSGVDSNLVRVSRRPPVPVRQTPDTAEEWVDFGHVGDIVSVDISLLVLLLKNGYTPVVASLAGDGEGNVYNVNADTIAQALAGALEAARLVIFTNVPGILSDPGDPASILRVCTVAQLEGLIHSGTISGGMLPKVHNCVEALAAGVRQVQILDGTRESPRFVESLNSTLQVGTLVVSEEADRI